MLELRDTVDITRYRDTNRYRSIPSFGIVGINHAIYNQIVDDFGPHFQLIWVTILMDLDQTCLHIISINVIIFTTSYTKL